MRRSVRCVTTLLAAIAVASVLHVSAQTPSTTPVITPPAPPDLSVPAPKAKVKASGGDKLAVRMKLGDGRRVWHPTRRQIGVVFAPGFTGAQPGPIQFTIDAEKLRKYLTAIAPYVRRLPTNASVAVGKWSPEDDGSGQVPAKIIHAKPGAVLDIEAAVVAVQKSILQDPGVLHIVLPLKESPARLGDAQLAGIDSRIGYFVTHFNPGERGRTMTVRRAISIIDGKILAPGEVFSINGTVGERTVERGFGIGHVFVDGKMDKQVGGGMCQVATTLFNAAMLADLKIVERHQHVRTIPYVSPGRDATVYWGQKDFKIQNDTAFPIFISYKTNRTHAIVSIFGHGVPGRKVKLVSIHRRLGERHFTGTFYRVVSMPDGTTHKDHVYKSDYKWTPALDYQR